MEITKKNYKKKNRLPMDKVFFTMKSYSKKILAFRYNTVSLTLS
jgi:hypothetical protein